MTDRLKELQRQRALVQEQLAWLDREIATARSTIPTSEITPFTVKPPVSAATVKPAQIASTQAASEAAAEEILAQYKKENQSLEKSVKRGCFLYFFIALALLGLVVFALYLFRNKS